MFKLLSFEENDRIFNEIAKDNFWDDFPNMEESLRGTRFNRSVTSFNEYFLPCRWHLTFLDDITESDLVKIYHSLPSLYLTYFQKVFPNYTNFYSLRLIDAERTAQTIDMTLVIDCSEARVRNLL
ncbi:hypothetical protein ACEF17_01845 [Streptococcus hyovaginalis]